MAILGNALPDRFSLEKKSHSTLGTLCHKRFEALSAAAKAV
jgi:hypothetical protein